MQIQIRRTSGVAILINGLGSLPAYALLTFATFLNFDLFLNLLGAGLLSSVLAKAVMRLVQGTPRNPARAAQEKLLNIVNAIIPGVKQSVESPVIRRLTAALSVLTYTYPSTGSIVFVAVLGVTALYVKIVEEGLQLTQIAWGFILGGVSAAVFLAL
jgi:hypothetical protein